MCVLGEPIIWGCSATRPKHMRTHVKTNIERNNVTERVACGVESVVYSESRSASNFKEDSLLEK